MPDIGNFVSDIFTPEEVRGKLFYLWADLSRKYDCLMAQKGAAIVQNQMDIPIYNLKEWKQDMLSTKATLDAQFEDLMKRTIEYLIKDK